jgi:hypothetical protein
MIDHKSQKETNRRKSSKKGFEIFPYGLLNIVNSNKIKIEPLLDAIETLASVDNLLRITFSMNFRCL